MLTQLFALDTRPPTDVYRDLHLKARWFGEGLQLVNILKDAEADAAEGRQFIPQDVSIDQVLELARNDLRVAEQYVSLLRQSDAAAGGWRLRNYL